VASLDHELAGVGGSSVAVTSVGLGDSRTSTTLSSATAAWRENRKVLLIDADERTPAVLAASDALRVAGQADGVVLVVSHRVSLGRLRDVRERLAFVKTPLIGYIYLRPRGVGVRTLWERLQRSARRGAGTPTVGPKRKQRA
jgi:Mrp family chromosome partitioning ATPase